MNKVYKMKYKNIETGEVESFDSVSMDRLDFAGTSSPIRTVVLSDGTTIEFPANRFVFSFSSEREVLLKKFFEDKGK